MRVSTAFNTMLGIPGATVVAVRFEPTCVVVRLRRRERRPICPCGWKGRAV
jgi:transposase